MQTVEKMGASLKRRFAARRAVTPLRSSFSAPCSAASGETVEVDGFTTATAFTRCALCRPSRGAYTYETRGSFPEAAGRGEFTVTAPGAGSHGPMRVVNQYHFAYEDGTPYYSVGTTCYVWCHQPEDIRQKDTRGARQGIFQ